MGVIESDDMTISRKLMGKVSYSESFDIASKLLFFCLFLDYHCWRQSLGVRALARVSINNPPV